MLKSPPISGNNWAILSILIYWSSLFFLNQLKMVLNHKAILFEDYHFLYSFYLILILFLLLYLYHSMFWELFVSAEFSSVAEEVLLSIPIRLFIASGEIAFFIYIQFFKNTR